MRAIEERSVPKPIQLQGQKKDPRTVNETNTIRGF
jgi:hypothetical protein